MHVRFSYIRENRWLISRKRLSAARDPRPDRRSDQSCSHDVTCITDGIVCVALVNFIISLARSALAV